MPSDPLYEKLRFNGFRVAYWNHETRCIEHIDYDTSTSLKEAGFDTFPTVAELIDGMFAVYGDVVGLVTDVDGNILFEDKPAITTAYDRSAF